MSETLKLTGIAKDEASLSKSIFHLHAKPPVVDKGQLYMVMREFSGITLFDLMKKRSKNSLYISTDHCLQISINIMKALKSLHKQRVIHQDIKPENIIVDPISCEVNIIDVGLASRMNRLPSGGGTRSFAAPEVFTKGADAASDVYSLGLVLRLLWGGTFDEKVIEKIISRRLVMDESCVFNSECLKSSGLTKPHQKSMVTALNDLINFYPDERSLGSALYAFEEIRIQRKIKNADKVTQKAILLANTSARELENHLPDMVGTNLDQFLTDLEAIIMDAVDCLPEHPLVLEEFNAILNIALFKGAETNADMLQLLTMTIASFKDAQAALTLKLAQSDLTCDQRDDLQLVLNKYSRSHLTLDDIARITKKAQNLLNELEPAPRLVLN
ncbi:MAG: protein kinase [Gammaproteobacteria bacterium]